MVERYNRARVNASPVGKATPMQEYLITDPDHRPDLNNEFAGARVQYRGGRQYVRLTKSAAQFYIDQGVIEPVIKEEPAQ